MSDQDGAACDSAFLAAAALMRCAASAGSEHFDPSTGASGGELVALWSDVYDRVVPCMSAATASKLGDVLTDAMVADMLPGFARSVSAELAEFRQMLLQDGLSFQGCRRIACVVDVAAGA